MRAPGHTFAVWVAAPTPVETPHPSRHPLRSGSSVGIGIACAACTTVCVASVPSESVPASGAASRARRTRGGCVHACEHRRGTPRRHGPARPAGHRPGQHDRIADRGRLDPVADFLDDAGALVAEQHRERCAPVPVLDRPAGPNGRRRSPPSGRAPRPDRAVDLELFEAGLLSRSRPTTAPTDFSRHALSLRLRAAHASVGVADGRSGPSRPHDTPAIPSSWRRSRPWSTSTAVPTRRRA